MLFLRLWIFLLVGTAIAINLLAEKDHRSRSNPTQRMPCSIPMAMDTFEQLWDTNARRLRR